MTFHHEDSGGAPAAPAVAAAIERHRLAYLTRGERFAELENKRRDFDPELQFETEAEIRAALKAAYGDQAPVAELYLHDLEASATAATEAEDAAWLAFRSMVPADAAELQAWLHYVLEHAARSDEEVVLLREGLTHVAGVLAARLAL